MFQDVLTVVADFAYYIIIATIMYDVILYVYYTIHTTIDAFCSAPLSNVTVTSDSFIEYN